MLTFRAVLVFLLLALPAAAQERPLSPEAFLDAVEGLIVRFETADDGALVGVERFVDRDRSVWTRPDGRCALGAVDVRGEQLCFVYEDEPGVEHCWWPFEDGGDLFVRSTRTGEVQRIGGLSERLLGCEGELMS